MNRLGRMDAVIHNAGVSTGRHVLPVNLAAPYLLTAPIDRPSGCSTSPAASNAVDPGGCPPR